MAIDTGHGATLVFATSGFVASYTDFDGFEASRPTLDSSHLTTANYRTKFPGDLADVGPFSGNFLFDQAMSILPPVIGARETVTLAFATHDYVGANSFMTMFRSPRVATDELLIAAMTVQWGEYPTLSSI